jgi:hypothetical protein
MSQITATVDALTGTSLDRDEAAGRFEEASPRERVEITESIDGRAQARLWEACEGRSVTIAEMVPPDFEPLRPVIFHGKNSLALFTRFQKRFCRAPADAGDVLWGYNYQPTRWLAPLTGPGYFTAYDSPGERGSVAIDYTRIPPAKPADWPEIHDNTYRLSRFIYNGTIDYMRRVSEHLLIGRATRDGKDMPNYFLLCREDPR